MPAERRSLRSNNKSDTSSSANGEKARSNSQSSSAKDKAAPTTRAAANKAKAAPAKKGAKGASDAAMGEDDKSNANGSKSTENGVNGSEDVEMEEDTAGAPSSSINSSKNRNGNEKMTVVVPPTKGSKSTDKKGQEKDGDVAMEGAEDDDAEAEPEIDPATKAIQGSFELSFTRSQKDQCLTRYTSLCLIYRYQDQLHPPRASRRPLRSPIYPPCPAIDILHAETHHPRGPRRSDFGNIPFLQLDSLILAGCSRPVQCL